MTNVHVELKNGEKFDIVNVKKEFNESVNGFVKFGNRYIAVSEILYFEFNEINRANIEKYYWNERNDKRLNAFPLESGDAIIFTYENAPPLTLTPEEFDWIMINDER